MKLDEYDLKILELLTQNSRLSYSEIGKLLGLSRQTVKARIERLENEGIIEGYTVKLSKVFDDRRTFFILVKSDRKPENFVELYKVGKRLYLIKIQVSKPDELAEFAEDFEVLSIMPIIDHESKIPFKSIQIQFRCDYCGKEVEESPVVYKRHNKAYLFCCETCLEQFKEINY